MPVSDSILVARTRQGDERAFAELVERHVDRAYAAAFAVLGNRDDARDVCQDSFVHALDRLGTLREPERFGSWLVLSVRRRAIDLARSASKRRETPLDRARSVPAAGDPLRHAVQTDIRERLLRVIQDLPEREREVLVLHDVEGWKHREIAGHLDLPEGTVRYVLSRARAQVREELGRSVMEDLRP